MELKRGLHSEKEISEIIDYAFHIILRMSTCLILNPRPLFINNGNSILNIYHAKLLKICVIHKAQNGTEVSIDFQGTD